MDKRYVVSLIFLFVLSTNITWAQKLLNSRRSSYYTYIFQISNYETEKIYKKGLYKVNNSIFHTKYDSFPTGLQYDKALPFGHYLFVCSKNNKIEIELRSVSNVEIRLVKNHSDLAVIVHDSAGKEIKNASIYLKSKTIKYDPKVQSYRVNSTKKDGILKVVHEEFPTYYSLSNSYKIKNIPTAIVYGIPVKYLWMPFRDAIKSIQWGYPQGMIEEIVDSWEDFKDREYSDNFKGYMAFNKPKYMPGDTVKLKAFITNKKGKPVKQPLEAVIGYGKEKKSFGVISPYRKGAYELEFILHDSLKLKLDKEYILRLEKKPHKDLISGKFRYEDYELKLAKFSLRSSLQEHMQAEPMAVYLRGTDENDLNLLESRVHLTILPHKIHEVKKSVFVADTMWAHQQRLDPLGETKIVLPDSIFPNCDLSYKIVANFFTISNERTEKVLVLRYTNKAGKFFYSLKNDSLIIDYLTFKGVIPKAVSIIGSSATGKILIPETSITIPHQLKTLPYLSNLRINADSIVENYPLSNFKPNVSCLAYRTKDSLFVNVDNPGNIPFWYTIYRKNKVVTRGYGTSLDFNRKSTTSHNYFVSLQYLWTGNIIEDNYTVGYADKTLNVDIRQPEMIFPGQKVPVDLFVTDASGKPVKDVDLTAYGITTRFKDYTAPSVPDFNKIYKERKPLNSFGINNKNFQSLQALGNVNWDFWNEKIGLDTIMYYQFMYPGKDIFRYYFPASRTRTVKNENEKDSLASLELQGSEKTEEPISQFAPFVTRNGSLESVVIIYVDEKPVYFEGADSYQPYSFEVEPGLRNIRLRTMQHEIKLNGVPIEKGRKLIFSLEADKESKVAEIKEMPHLLTQKEIDVLKRYFVIIKQNHPGILPISAKKTVISFYIRPQPIGIEE